MKMKMNSHRARGSVLPAVLAGIFLLPTLLRASGPITEFPVPTTDSGLQGIAAGSDGNLWFCEINRNKIGRATPQGEMTEFDVTLPPREITPGPDGNMWFAAEDFDTGGEIGRISPAGEVKEFFVLSACGIAAGPDGNLWFTSCGGLVPAIGRITTSGDVTLFPVSKETEHRPDSIAAGPDGNLWFTEGPLFGRITTTGAVTEFPPVSGGAGSITAGPDGNLWFTQQNAIGRSTLSGEITMYPIPSGGTPRNITAGPDSNLWFTEYAGIGRITPDGQIAEIPLPASSGPSGITVGPDHAIWFTESGSNKIGRLDLAAVASCFPDAQTLCLGIFRITAAWEGSGQSGAGKSMSITPNAGAFWFSDPSNIELFVKILDACATTGKFDVYVNGLTHLGVTISVTNVRTGASRSYANPDGKPFSLIFDGSTFACP
jgi:streptogramin lyase